MDLQNFLYSLLGKRKRRILILSRWHGSSVPIANCNSFQEVLIAFFKCMLYEPLQISMYPDHLKLFQVQGLPIYYAWLLPHEKEFVKHLYLNRHDYFLIKQQFANGQFVFSKATIPQNYLPIQYRREVVRDFVWMFMARKDFADINHSVLVYVAQQLLIERLECDRFIIELHAALQGKFELNNMLCF